MGQDYLPDEDVARRLIELFKHSKLSKVRQAGAFLALGKLGEHAAPAVPEITKCLADEDSDVRIAAAEALGELGEHAASALPALTKCLADGEDRFVRWAAVEAVGK